MYQYVTQGGVAHVSGWFFFRIALVETQPTDRDATRFRLLMGSILPKTPTFRCVPCDLP